MLSHVWLFSIPWTVARLAPLSTGFSRQEYWGGLLFPPPKDLPNPGTEPASPALAGRSFTSESPVKPHFPAVDSLFSLLESRVSICLKGLGEEVKGTKDAERLAQEGHPWARTTGPLWNCKSRLWLPQGLRGQRPWLLTRQRSTRHKIGLFLALEMQFLIGSLQPMNTLSSIVHL